MIPRCKTPINRGQMHISPGTTLTFSDTDTYEKIIGTWSDGCANNFTVDDTNDRLIYTGKQKMCFLVDGVSDIACDQNVTITYGLYKNGSLVEGAETPHTFFAANNYSTVAISVLMEIETDDYFEVWAKTSGSSTLTINSLTLRIAGEN